ncbi:MAG: hypothetical protein M3Y81_21585 [Chloroflexota bacterium]|nr:hypothetical protein [Chloroflexota bacterium]
MRQRLLLTLLFLGAVGLSRTWDLRGSTADGLALLTGRMRAYGYRYTEAFVSQLARADGAERFTDALASWTTHLWHSTEDTGGAEHPSPLTGYIDGHRKPVYGEVLIPRGLIGRLGVVSPSPSVPRVAFLLRRREPTYRESLIIYGRAMRSRSS